MRPSNSFATMAPVCTPFANAGSRFSQSSLVARFRVCACTAPANRASAAKGTKNRFTRFPPPSFCFCNAVSIARCGPLLSGYHPLPSAAENVGKLLEGDEHVPRFAAAVGPDHAERFERVHQFARPGVPHLQAPLQAADARLAFLHDEFGCRPELVVVPVDVTVGVALVQ